MITLKHGTCECRSEKILVEGLDSRAFLTDSEEIALYYAECALDDCSNNCGEMTYFEATVDEKELRADWASYEEPLTFFRNRYTSCEREWFEMIESGEITMPENSNDYKTSLEVVNSVLHFSAIKPKQLKRA